MVEREKEKEFFFLQSDKIVIKVCKRDLNGQYWHWALAHLVPQGRREGRVFLFSRVPPLFQILTQQIPEWKRA